MANETNPIPGKYGMLFRLEDSGTTPLVWRPLACFTSHEFNPSRTINEEPVTKCAPDAVSKSSGALNVQITGEATVFDTDGSSAKDSWEELYEIMKTGEKEWFLYDTNTDNPSSYKQYFEAFITELPLTQEVENNSTFSLTLDVNGVPETTEPTFV